MIVAVRNTVGYRFLEPWISQTSRSFEPIFFSLGYTSLISARFLELPYFSNVELRTNFGFPWRFKKTGFYCSILLNFRVRVLLKGIHRSKHCTASETTFAKPLKYSRPPLMNTSRRQTPLVSRHLVMLLTSDKHYIFNLP